MADPTYGKRTGVTTLRKLTEHICRLILSYGNKINDWIDTWPDAEQRTVIRAWLVATQAACILLMNHPDD